MPQAKRWTHFAAVWDGQKCRLFADGKLASESNVISDQPDAPTGPFTLGQNTGSFTANFKGVMDELTNYDRALDEREIADLYDAAAKGAAKANPQSPALHCTTLGLSEGAGGRKSLKKSWWTTQ